jgi:hypothetical protein
MTTTMPGARAEPLSANPQLNQADQNPYPPPPPNVQFWQRYSPHHEAPISATSSLFLHALVILLLIGAVWVGWKFSHQSQLDFGVVKIPGGGGGDPNGDGPAPGIGAGHEDFLGITPDQQALPDNGSLKDTQVKGPATSTFDNDPAARRTINAGDENIEALARLKKLLHAKMPDGVTPGKGEGGPGSGGGKDSGNGPRNGSGTGNGDGKSVPTPREKRMLRWVMVLETQNAADYVKQLHGLGAIVAIPNKRDDYDVVEDLTARPAKLVTQDVAKLDRIYWADKNPTSVRGLLNELRIQQTASHFVAFMPKSLEAKLADIELKYQGLREEEIDETHFKVFRSGAGYDVKVASQSRIK